MQQARVLIFVVTYNAKNFISDVLNRIPDTIWLSERFDTECLIIDDSSSDGTCYEITKHILQHPEQHIVLLHNPQNQGYGGNQKIGYYYAIQNSFDVVVLLHGDGQYPPELIESMVVPILNGEADAVFGSRMIHKQQALEGRMPLYKWVGNQILTYLQNKILGSHLSEFHTGFRAYSIPALKVIPFANNSNYFDFDSDIIIQMLNTKKRIMEIPIPTTYRDEISHVNSFKYGLLILRTSLLSRMVPHGIFYHPKFDYSMDNSYYTLKLGYSSSHQFAIDHIRPESVVLDLGCGPGYMARELGKKQVKTISVDKFISPESQQYSLMTIETNVEQLDFTNVQLHVDYVLLLDIIEHLKSPETLFQKLRDCYGSESPEIIITTANIAFIVIRLSLLFGQFNYGKRGILDLDHARLFTFLSLRRVLTMAGYEIVKEQGIPAPFPLAVGENWLGYLLLSLNIILIRLSKKLFAYQIAIVAKPKPTLQHLLQHAQISSKNLVENHTAI